MLLECCTIASACADVTLTVYEEDDEGFSFSKRLRSKTGKAPAVRTSTAERTSPAKPQPARQAESMALEPAPAETAKSKTAQKKAIRRFPDTPERNAAEKKSRPGTKPIPNAQQGSPIKHAHAKSHANHERSPSPFRARPVTVAKKRKGGAEEAGEETVTRIQLPFADTPVIVRNIQMRKASAENGSRRSSSGMRGRRASSLIDEGRGNGESLLFIHWCLLTRRLCLQRRRKPKLELSIRFRVMRRDRQILAYRLLHQANRPLRLFTMLPALLQMLKKTPLTTRLHMQLCHTPKYQPQNSINTSQPNSWKHDVCDVYSAGVGHEHCLRSLRRRGITPRLRTQSSRLYKQVRFIPRFDIQMLGD